MDILKQGTIFLTHRFLDILLDVLNQYSRTFFVNICRNNKNNINHVPESSDEQDILNVWQSTGVLGYLLLQISENVMIINSSELRSLKMTMTSREYMLTKFENSDVNIIKVAILYEFQTNDLAMLLRFDGLFIAFTFINTLQ